LGGVLPKAIFLLWGVLQNERYDGGPLTSASTLHANCASHPQLSYFWQSHTDEDGAATRQYVMKRKNMVMKLQLVSWFCELTNCSVSA
jgi:hypothetical protein